MRFGRSIISLVFLFSLSQTLNIRPIAQFSSRPAQTCDCDGTCPVRSSTSGLSGMKWESQSDIFTGIQPLKPSHFLNPNDLEYWQVAPFDTGGGDSVSDDLQQYLEDQSSTNRGETWLDSGADSEEFTLNVPDYGDYDSVITDDIDSYQVRLNHTEVESLFDQSGWADSIDGKNILEDLPDFKMADPGYSGGSSGSDIRKQSRPGDVDRCTVAVDRSQKPESVTCSDSIKALCQNDCSYSNLRQRLSSGSTTVRANTVVDLASYDRACLDRTGRTGQVIKEPFDQNYIFARTGSLFVNAETANPQCLSKLGAAESDGQIFVCSAAIVDRNRLVTARHCLVKPNNGWSPLASCLSSGSMEFSTFSNPARYYEVKPLSQEQSETLVARRDIDNDYAFLRTSTDIVGITDATKVRRAEIYAPAFIAAYHELVPPAGLESWPVWRSKVRWSRPHCTVIRSVNSCAVTKCQTINGFSGAPVWTLTDDGETRLSGIQVEGGTGRYSQCYSGNMTDYVTDDGNLFISGFMQ